MMFCLVQFFTVGIRESVVLAEYCANGYIPNEKF